MIAFATIGGGLYAALLWQLARVIAARRSLALGRFPVIAFVTSMVCAAVSITAAPGIPSALLGAGVIGAVMCGVVDARTGYIFDGLTIAMSSVALSAAAGIGSLPTALLSGGAVGGSMLALYALTRGRGIGLGDVKLATALALSFGLAWGAIAVGAAFVIGAAYGIVLLLRHRAKRGDAIRFGPFMAAGAIFALAVDIVGIHL